MPDGGEDSSRFSVTKGFTAAVPALDCEDHVTSASLSPSEETVALAIAGSQLLSFDLAHAAVKEEAGIFAPLGPASHGPPVAGSSGPGAAHDLCSVLGLDAAVRKPLIATTGVDNSGAVRGR